MKEFSSVIFWSIVFALILVSSVAAKYISIPADSMVSNIVGGSEIPKEILYLLFIGSIALIAGFIHQSRNNKF